MLKLKPIKLSPSPRIEDVTNLRLRGRGVFLPILREMSLSGLLIEIMSGLLIVWGS